MNSLVVLLISWQKEILLKYSDPIIAPLAISHTLSKLFLLFIPNPINTGISKLKPGIIFFNASASLNSFPVVELEDTIYTKPLATFLIFSILFSEVPGVARKT